MKTKIKTLCLVCIMLLLQSPSLEAKTLPSYINFFDGNGLVEWMREYEKAMGGATDREAKFQIAGNFEGYVWGVYETSCISIKYNGLKAGTTLSQLCAVVIKYLKEHPERWHEPARSLVCNALMKAFDGKYISD